MKSTQITAAERLGLTRKQATAFNHVASEAAEWKRLAESRLKKVQKQRKTIERLSQVAKELSDRLEVVSPLAMRMRNY